MNADETETTNDETNNQNIMNADETKTSVDGTETTNDETKSTAIVSTGLVVVVSNVKYPKKGLKPVSAENVMGAIKQLAFSMFSQKNSKKVKPVLQDITYDSVTGCVLVECANEETRDWLHKVLPKIGKGRSNIPSLKAVTEQVAKYPKAHQNSTDETKSTAVETNSLIVAISCVKYPSKHLKPTQASQVLNRLKKKALRQFRQKQSKIKPVLQNVTFDSVTGCVMVECADMETFGWVHEVVPKTRFAKTGFKVKVVSKPMAKKPKVLKAAKKPKVPKDAVSNQDIWDESEDFKDEPTFIANLDQSGNYSGNSNRNGNSGNNRNSSGNYRGNSNKDGNSSGNRDRNGSNSHGGSGNSCNERNSFTRGAFVERSDNSNRSNSGNSFDGTSFVSGSSNSYRESIGGNYGGNNANSFGDNPGNSFGSSGNSYTEGSGWGNYSSDGRNWNTSGGNSSSGSTRRRYLW